MNIIIKFLKWQFALHGIVVVEETGHISKFEALKRLFSGVVRRDPKGPTPEEQTNCMRIFHHPLKRCRCKFCGLHFWTWRKKRDVCYKWSCVRQT